MKSIAFIHSASQMSGVEFSTLYLLEHLDRARWVPHVICPEEGDLPAHVRARGGEVSIVPRPRFYTTSLSISGHNLPNAVAWAADAWALLKGAEGLTVFLRRYPPQLVVTKGLLAHFYGGLAARWSRIPCVWHVQDRVSERLGPLFPWTMALSGWALAREVIVDAGSIAQQLKRFVPPGRISIIWNGVDTNLFRPDAEGRARTRAEWNVKPEEILIGVIARLTPWKGQHVLLEALDILANQFPLARVVLVGSALFATDTYARTLHSEVKRRGLSERVNFAGFRGDLPQVLAALDIVVHTSLEKESSPLAVVSAMAAGTPIVCTRVAGTEELFDDGDNGLLVAPGRADLLASKLCLLLQNPNLRQHLGSAARNKAERELNVQRYASRCEQVFDRALQ